MTPAEIWFRDAPDSAFPVVHAGFQMMLETVRCGWAQHVRCRACDRTVIVTGRDLCERHGAWLMRPLIDWARTLRCGECGSRRVQVTAYNDPGAHRPGPSHESFLNQMACLNDLLPLAGIQLADIIVGMRDLPAIADLRRVGLNDAADALERASRG